MKVALVFVPLLLEKNWSALKAQDKHIGIMPPLSLAYVASTALGAGHDVIIIDAAAERLNLDGIVARIKEYSPDILGFTITTYGFHQTLSWIRKIKQRTGLPVVAGGWHFSLYPQETMSHPEIDYAVIGEAGYTFPEFLQALQNGSDLSQIEGLIFRKGDEVVMNAPRRQVPDINQVPFPARHLLKNELYYNILTKRRNFTVMLSARGCPFRCLFCDLKSIKFRQRSAVNFVDEIEQCHRTFNVNEIDIYDSSFTINKKRVFEICSEIRRRNLDIVWSVRTRVDCVNKEMLSALKSAGCHTLMYGIESGNRDILKNLRKDVSLEYIREVVEFTKECGMKALGFFIVGAPGETKDTIRQTMRFANSLPLDYIQVTRMTPLPNTEIYQMYLKKYGRDYWRDFTKDISVERQLPLVGTNITHSQALKYIRKIYLGFYFRPGYIFRALMRINSFLEFKNSVLAALGMLTSRQHLE